MACIIVPATEAVVTTVLSKIVKHREKQPKSGTAWSTRLGWLNRMLWGGSALLAFEHVWHGEITPFPPFLTAAANPADMQEMFREMSTVGVSMAVLVTAVWGLMVWAEHAVARHTAERPAPESTTV